MLEPDGVIAFVVGDVVRGSHGFISLAREFIQRVLHSGRFSYIGCFADEIRHDIKTTRIWGDTKGKTTETDRIVILANKPPTFHHDRLAEALHSDKGIIGEVPPIDTADLITKN